MRQIFILTILLATNPILFAQKLPKFIQERIEFCDANFSDNQAIQLRKELNELEDYFVKKGLLTDKAGKSYRAVYERIAKENDLNFEIDTTFELLAALEFEVYTGCFYKVLSPEQLSELTFKDQEAAERIAEGYEGDVTPGIVAQRIIDNLTVDDFKLEFYKVSSLLTFYRIAHPAPTLDFGLLEFSKNMDSNIKTIEIVLNENNSIKIGNSTMSLDEAKQRVFQFLLTDPNKKGVELSVSRDASYESYMELIEMLNSVYSELNKKFDNVAKNIIINEPK
ncbi:hypothetical protein AAG747_22995 [Rapidithrix thailandica]|uniref:DUF2059 domain-containing protein n=1 Tax=Rapidithrix thailandica TaxID=413964 RepID=A0AAW9SBI7_9BACT